MNMRLEHMELEALEAGLRESGGFAVRVLRSAAAACAGRDAGRANVVLGFEADARRDHGRAGAAARSLLASSLGPGELDRVRSVVRTQAAVERTVGVALRVADLARLSSRRGAPDIDHLDRLCRLAGAVAGTVAESLLRSGYARDQLLSMAEELLQRTENAAAICERELDAGRHLCLVS
jgi:hypothetical protein